MVFCFSKKNFDYLTETEKTEYLKNHFFFCNECHFIFNMYLIRTNENYNDNKTYFSLFKCKNHNYKIYDKWYL